MPGSLTFEFKFTTPKAARPVDADQPMRLLIMGDFSGRADATPGANVIGPVDIDNLDRIMARMAPSCPDVPGFDGIDDFTPDALFRRLPLFQSLRQLRADLLNPATFATAAASLRDADPATPDGSAGASDFAQLLGGTVQRPQGASSGIDIGTVIKNIVGAIPSVDPMQGQYVAAVDEEIGRAMRAILHAPAFRAVESAWRDVHFLITNLELDHTLQVHLLDMGKDALGRQLQAAQGNLEATGLYQLLVQAGRAAPDSAAWSAIIGAYTFAPTEDDLATVAAMGALGAQAGAPFIAATNDPGQWDDDDRAAWQALRTCPWAAWIGMGMPAYLQRLPYGKNTDRVDQFDFEEAAADPRDTPLLWGSAGVVCARLLGQAFMDAGWEMEPGDALEVDDLLAYSYKIDGVPHLQACAQVGLSEATATALAQQGVMPLLSYKNRAALRLLRSQSVASPSQALRGPWA